MKSLLMYVVLTLYFVGLSFSSLATTIYTCRGKESPNDIRAEYDIALFRLALDKTVSTHGEYQLNIIPNMNTSRGLKAALANTWPNFFTKQSVSKKRLEQLSYVDFPVDLGVVGYRIFFVSPQAKDKLDEVENIEQLKSFTIGQGIGWLDSEILKHNGFRVILGSPYESLFKMVAKGRFDLFSRGSNEIYAEYQVHQSIGDLLIDKRLALYYPLPRFFFSHHSNVEATQRIKQGLLMAYDDGSLMKLWNQYYADSIRLVELKNRKIFQIENPFLQGIDNSYQQYIYQP
ncbi:MULTISPECIES: hypothetical protein [unclassified Agarivorans]|uniref:hypothetical protein n=1 Tax=unclassified Agarivorans TaxID=2636026 RepID=UPI003D7D6581